jgi:hypothetical protein
MSTLYSVISETKGYNRYYLASRIGQLVPIWQPIIISSFLS